MWSLGNGFFRLAYFQCCCRYYSHSFLLPNNTILYGYTIFSLPIHQLMDICSLQLCAIINNAVMNIHLQVFIQT